MHRAELLDRFRAADDPVATARTMTDRDLIDLFNGISEEPGDPGCDAVTAEIQRRELDL